MGLMKKLTSVVVTAGLLVGLAGNAFAAYPDGVSTAAKRMQDLNLVQGKGGGDLALNDNITRAELVTIIVRAFGKADDAKFLKGASAFPDTASHWASGEIALAKNIIEANGFSMGMPDGTFAPNGQVTAAQAVAFLMKFLGAPADSAKAWPENYLSGAVTAGLMTADDKAAVEAVANSNATRGLVFYLADGAFGGYKLADGKTVYTKYVKPAAPTVTIDEIASPTTEASVAVSGSVSSDATEVYVGTSTTPVAVSGGKFSANVDLAVGENTINVTAKDLAGNSVTKAVSVTRTVGAAAKIDVPATLTVAAGEAADLAVAVKDAAGNTIKDAPVDVTSDLGSYADGKFTAGTKAGAGTITVKSGDLSATVNVTVNPGALAKLAVSPATIDLTAGGSQKFTVEGQDANGNAVDVSGVTWSASKGIIAQDGTFGATTDATGTVTVTATAGTATGTATVTVFGAATKITAAAPSGLVANSKSTGDLVISVVDANGNVAKNYSGTVTLVNNSNTIIGKMSATSVAVVNGTATVTLTAGSASGSAAISISGTGLQGYVVPVTVAKQVATSVKVTADPATLAADNVSVSNLSAVLQDQTGNSMVSATSGYTIDFVVSDTNIVTGANMSNIGLTLDGTDKVVEIDKSGALPYVTAKNALGSVTVTATVKYNGVASSTVTANSVSISTALVGVPYKLAIDPISNAKTTGTDATGDTDLQKVVVRVLDVNGNQVTSDSASSLSLSWTGAASGSTVTQSSNTLAAGKKTFTVQSNKVATLSYTVTGTWNSNTLTQATASGSFVAGPASSVTLSASPSNIAATGSGTSVLTAKIVDANSNAVTDGSYAIKFARTAGGNAIANWADQTVNSVNGVATVTVNGTTNLATDTFQASTTMDGTTKQSSTVTVSTKILGTPNQLTFATYGSGVYTAFDTTTGQQTYTTAQAGQAYKVYVAVEDANALSGGVVDISGGVYHRNVVTYDNSTVVTLTATDTSDVTTTYTATAVNGIATFALTLNSADDYTLKATANNLKSADGGAGNNAAGLLTVHAGDAVGLKLTSNSPTLGADGSYATIKVTMVDTYGNAVEETSTGTVYGLQVTSSNTGVATVTGTQYFDTVDASGSASGASSNSQSAKVTVTATTTPGTTTVTATKNGLTSATYTLTTAVVGSVARANVVVDDTYTVTSTPTQKVTVTLLDANGNRVTNVPSGVYVKLAKNSSASATIYGSDKAALSFGIQQATTANAGATSFYVADTKAENVTYTATLVDANSATPNTLANTSQGTATGTFTADKASKIDIAVSPDSANDSNATVSSVVYGNGSNVVVLTVSVTDQFGNTVSDASGSVKVNLTGSSSAYAFIQGADSAGYYTTSVSNGQAVIVIQTRDVYTQGNVSVNVQYSKDGTFASSWTLSGSQGHDGSNIITVQVPAR